MSMNQGIDAMMPSVIKQLVKSGDGRGINLDAGIDDISRKVLRRLKHQREIADYFVLDPRCSRFLLCWDVLCLLTLLYVATFTPFECAFFFDIPWSEGRIYFVLNRIVDAVFFIDVIIHFFVAAPRENHPAGGGTWSTTVRETSRHYLRGWFAIDLLTLLPSLFDILDVVLTPPVVPLPPNAPTPPRRLPDVGWVRAEGPSGVRLLFALRVVRVLRLLKMLRLIRVNRVLARLSFDSAMFAGGVCIILELSTYILFAAHWFACCIGLQAAWCVLRSLPSCALVCAPHVCASCAP